MPAATTNTFDVLRLVLGLILLGVASCTDLRTRKVGNRLWSYMLGAGIVIMLFDMMASGADQALLLTPVPVVIVFVTIFTEGELSERLSGKANLGLTSVMVLVAIGVLWYQGEALAYDDRWIRVLHIPIMLFLAYLFYGFGLLHGGADAKALMGLAVLVPLYPVLDGLPFIENLEPITLLLPFAFVVLMNSALMTLLVPLGMAIYNATRGDVGGLMFFGYRLPLGQVKGRHVWLMEKVKDGEVVTFLVPRRGEWKDTEEQLRQLRKKGRKRVWVNPKIPFMVPMWVGYLVSFVAGNLIFGFVGWLMGV